MRRNQILKHLRQNEISTLNCKSYVVYVVKMGWSEVLFSLNIRIFKIKQFQLYFQQTNLTCVDKKIVAESKLVQVNFVRLATVRNKRILLLWKTPF